LLVTNMRPRHPVSDVANRMVANAKDFGYGAEAAPFSKHGADLRNVGCGQLAWGSALLRFVGHVVFVVAKEKVLWVHAQRRITLVEHVRSVWHWAIGKHVCNAMRERVSVANLDLAVQPDLRAKPQMAFASFVGLLAHAKRELCGVVRWWAWTL
jgi:hypothetical protein